MKRTRLCAAVILSLVALSACGPGEVIVIAEVDLLNPESGERELRPIDDLEIQLLPYDRDAIFDSLGAAASSPEPQMPQELVIARDSIAQARQEWQDAEAQWLALRERLQEINQEITQYNPAEAQYRVLFNEYNQSEAAYASAESRRNQAFATFERLQQQTLSEMEAFAARLRAWEDEVFSDWDAIVAARLRETRSEVLADTTDATGRADFSPAPGQWWAHGRFPVATDELYWNLPLSVERGDPIEVRLNRENAESRPIL
jgi:hypothetical protein